MEVFVGNHEVTFLLLRLDGRDSLVSCSGVPVSGLVAEEDDVG